MSIREMKLLEAAKEILSDFNFYGEVIQHDGFEGYGDDTAIGQLQIAVDDYASKY